MVHTKEKWNARWLSKASAPLTPDSWLLRAIPFLSRGSVLDIACGRGRNAIYLAERGFGVTGVDISDQALKLLGQQAANRNLDITLLRSDLESAVSLPSGPFDVVCKFFYLQRSLLPLIKTILKPGGIIVIRTFSSAGNFSGGSSNPDIVLNPGELLDVCYGWEVLLHEEGLEQSQKTGGGLAGIVARKPS